MNSDTYDQLTAIQPYADAMKFGGEWARNWNDKSRVNAAARAADAAQRAAYAAAVEARAAKQQGASNADELAESAALASFLAFAARKMAQVMEDAK